MNWKHSQNSSQGPDNALLLLSALLMLTPEYKETQYDGFGASAIFHHMNVLKVQQFASTEEVTAKATPALTEVSKMV
jgi:hypothetical protein